MTIQLTNHARGVLLPVRAQPGARRDAIVGEHGGELKVAVSQPPEKGKANERIVEVLCEELSLRRSQIELVAGETSRSKKFVITGVSLEELQQRLVTRING
jgi:uncharacterized protein (TIGR00251 family)